MRARLLPDVQLRTAAREPIRPGRAGRCPGLMCLGASSLKPVYRFLFALSTPCSRSGYRLPSEFASARARSVIGAENSLLAAVGNFPSEPLFSLRILWAHIADNREFPRKFAVKPGLSGKTRRRRPVRGDCIHHQVFQDVSRTRHHVGCGRVSNR
jgi:hypothetical protein